ncbi:MAG: hypothetical protein FJW40_23210 [Acidobacteria bacterium]|nr:hypothetical protein [Acidobacteriota bacterium]
MQPMQDPYSVSRRPLDMEDYIDIIRRHKGWILGPAFAALVVSVVGAFLWPDTFISMATLRVVPPQIPDRLAPSNVNVDMTQRIQMMSALMQNTATLSNIINQYNLYPKDRKKYPMQDLVEDMRKDIRIGEAIPMARSMLGGGNNRNIMAFSITFAYSDRLLAQRVVNDLVSRFIDEQIRTGAMSSQQTTQFMQDDFTTKQKSLEEIEKKFAEFRARNQGRLPEQFQQNMSAQAGLENRIAATNSSINRVNQDKMLLESRLAILNDQLKVSQAQSPEDLTVEKAKNERLVAIDRDILATQTALEARLEQYQENHPDVRTLRANLAVLKRTRDNMAREEESKPPEANPREKILGRVQQKEVRDLEANIQVTQALIEARNVEIENLTKEVGNLEKQAKSLTERIMSSPSNEPEYDLLLRERAIAKEQYEAATAKKTLSENATKIENQKQGERLEVLDPANVPQTPVSPKRWMVILIGLGAGLCLGLFLAGLREVKDTTLKNLKDVRVYTQLAVLGSIPLLENDVVVRRRRRLGWLIWSTACLAGVVMMASSFLYYRSQNPGL